MKTPEMIPGTTESVSVEWLVANLHETVEYRLDEGYGDMVQSKATDSQFGSLVHAIWDEGFRIPVVIQVKKNRPGVLTLGNGHHRLTAAMLMVLDEILVYWSNTADYMCSGISYGTGDDDIDEYRHEDFLTDLFSRDEYPYMGTQSW